MAYTEPLAAKQCDEVRGQTTLQTWIDEERRARNQSGEIAGRIHTILSRLRGSQPTGTSNSINPMCEKVSELPSICDQMRMLQQETGNNLSDIHTLLGELEEHI